MANESQKAWHRECAMHGLEQSHRLEDGNFVCPECRKDHPPAPHHMKELERVEALKLTVAQKKMLELLGSAEREYVPNDYNFGGKSRLCERLVEMRLASQYPHGGYIITDGGRYLLKHINPTR